MLSNLVKIIIFVSGLAIGAFFMNLRCHSLEKAFEELKATSVKVEAENRTLVDNIRKEADATKLALEAEQARLQQTYEQYKEVHEALVKDKDAKIRALRAAAALGEQDIAALQKKILTSTGAEKVTLLAKLKELQNRVDGQSGLANSLDCLNTPMPPELIKGLNGIGTEK